MKRRIHTLKVRYTIAIEVVREINEDEVRPGDGFMDVDLGNLNAEQASGAIEGWEFIETQAIHQLNPDGSTGNDLLEGTDG
jgi:hypothetical protein